MAEISGFQEVAKSLTAEKMRTSPVRAGEKKVAGEKRSFLDIQAEFEMAVGKAGSVEAVRDLEVDREREECLRPLAGLIGSAKEFADELVKVSGESGEIRAKTLQEQLVGPMERTMDHFWATQYPNEEERQAARTEDAGVIVEMTIRVAMANEWAGDVNRIDPTFWRTNLNTPEGRRFATTILAQNEVLKSVPVELQPEISTPVVSESGEITLGQALIAAEGVEAVAGALKGDNTQAMIEELQEVVRTNQETANTMREVVKALKEKGESQSKPRQAEAKEERQTPSLETKEKEIETFKEAMDYLDENWRMAASLSGGDAEKLVAAMRVKQEAARWASQTNFFEDGKKRVVALMLELIGDDNYWKTIESTGAPRTDLGLAFASKLDELKGSILDTTDRKRAGLRDAWLDGVAREWVIAFLQAKDAAGHPGDRSREISELMDEKKYLGWGRVKTGTTRALIRDLAARAVSWDEQNDPSLRSWSEARRQAEVTVGQRFGGGFENFPISPPPAHYVAIFREGRYGSFERQWGDKVKFLSVLNSKDRLIWCYANMGAFANGVIQTKDWKGVVDMWLGDIKDSANLVRATREKMVGIKETERDLRAMMALSASARAMEGSAGSAATYVRLLTVDQNGDLDKQDTWADFLLHDDPEKYWRVVSQPLVMHYYRRILAQAGISLDCESGQTVNGKLNKVSSFKKVDSDTALSSKLFGFLKHTDGEKYKGGFEPYISDVLLATDDPAFVSAQAKLGVDESARWSAARLACDAFMVDKLTRWENEIRKAGEYPPKTNIKPYAGWGGDPLAMVLQPSFLSRKIKKVYSGRDIAIMDMTDRAFSPNDIFDRLGRTDVKPLPISMTGNLKQYARYNDALWQFLGGSRAAGIPSWTNETMTKTLPAIAELLDQVYGESKKNKNSEEPDNTGKQIVGAMMARILECKALAAAVESARPGFKDNLRILFNVGDPKEARPFLDVEKSIWGPDLDSKKGLLSSLVGGRTHLVLKDNEYGAEIALKNTWEILSSNDQDPEGRGRVVTLNRIGFILDVVQALAKDQKRR